MSPQQYEYSKQVKSSQVKASSNGGLLWCARRRERSGGRNWHGWMAPIPHVRLLLDHRGAAARSKSPISHQLRVGARVLTANSHCTIVLLETGTGTVSISSPRSLRFAATDRPPVSFHRFKDTQEDTGGSWDTQNSHKTDTYIPNLNPYIR